MSSTGPASVEQLYELHRLLTDRCLSYLRETPPEKLRGFMLAIIRAFLRDNGVRARLTTVKDLAKSLEELRDADIPFLPTLDEVH